FPGCGRGRIPRWIVAPPRHLQALRRVRQGFAKPQARLRASTHISFGRSRWRPFPDACSGQSLREPRLWHELPKKLFEDGHRRISQMKQTGTFTHAKRKQESLLAPLERPALQWLVRHFPPWVKSDHLTLLAILSMFGAGLCFWGARYDIRWLLAIPVALALNWFGDSTDGTLARYRNRQRPRYGFYVVFICDCLST